MLHELLQYDYRLFHWINNDLHQPFLDWLMPFWRSRFMWIPLYLFLALFIWENFGKKGLYFILILGATVGVTDFTSSSIIKINVKRDRPCNDPIIQNDVKLLVSCGGGYSFTSSHAANHFAMVVFLMLTLFRKRSLIKWIAICWAASISLGQVYVGVHYPLDVICGALVGVFISTLSFFIARKWFPDLKTISF